METGTLLGRGQPDRLDDHEIWAIVVAKLSHLKVTAFEAKALYTMAMIRQLAEAAIDLVRRESPLELPAYVLVADGIEALASQGPESGLSSPGASPFSSRTCTS